MIASGMLLMSVKYGTGVDTNIKAGLFPALSSILLIGLSLCQIIWAEKLQVEHVSFKIFLFVNCTILAFIIVYVVAGLMAAISAVLVLNIRFTTKRQILKDLFFSVVMFAILSSMFLYFLPSNLHA